MAIQLDDYQKDAVNRLKNGSILCGGVGSGKSRTGIAYYFCRECGGKIEPRYSKMKNPKNLYIITTARKRDTKDWEGELAAFLLSPDPDSCAYDISVKVDSWNNIKKYVKVKDSFFIFDEQRVVGSGAWVKAFLKITKANHWILLTATPGDTWMDYIPVFIANGFYRNKTDFENHHVVYKYFKNFKQVDRYLYQGKLIKYRNDILVNMDYLRPTEHHNITVHVEYDKILYKDIWKNRWNTEKARPVRNVSELCYLLRRVTNSDDSRYEAVLEITHANPKVIIFYNFDYELERLRVLDYKEGTVVKEYNGHLHMETPDADRWVYLVQYAAGAEAWNCIETDTIIFFSQTYSYKVLTQAKGRIDRRNTPYHDLYFYHLRSASPIDISIGRALKEKRNFNEKSFAG